MVLFQVGQRLLFIINYGLGITVGNGVQDNKIFLFTRLS